MVKFNRWVTLVSGMYMMMISGTIYLFPDYSNSLKAIMGYNVEQINFVGTLINTGTWAGVVGGLFFDKFGPRLTSLGGALMIFAGYFLMFLSANKTISGNSYAMAVFGFWAGQGSGWIYTAALNTNAVNFTKEDRGKILGLLACCFGLCAGIFTVVYRTFFDGNVTSFLLFLSLFLPFFAILFGCVFCNYLDEYPKEYERDKKRIYLGYGIMGTIVILICITSFVTNFTNTGPFVFCIVMFGIIGGLTVIFLGTKPGIIMPPPPPPAEVNTTSDEKTTPLIHSANSEIPLWKVVLMFDFWLLFFAFFAVIGAGITILNNINEMVMSLENITNGDTIAQANLPYAKYPTTFVILFSVFNTSGRLITGMVSDKFIRKLPRTAWVIIVAAIMSLTQVYFLLTSIPGIFGGIILLGLSYGGTFALVPTLTSELFGLKHFGANYGFIGIAPAIGSECISVLLAGKLTDTYKEKHYFTVTAGDTTNTHCLGRECYRYTLFVNLGLCLLAIVASLILTLRQRRKYTKLDDVTISTE